MNRKYRLHYGDYAVGENEKLYGDMAAKGWRLLRRGVWFSRFERAEPQNLRYRIELAAPADGEISLRLPDEQLAVYEECGWEYISGRGRVHVFAAEEGSDAPEFYTDPRQQADSLKALRRNYLYSGLMFLLFISWRILWSAISPTAGVQGFWADLAAEKTWLWVVATAPTLFVALLWLLPFYLFLYGAYRTEKLYRSLKRGTPLDHSPRKKHVVHRTISAALLAAMAVFLSLAGLQLLGHRKYDMPASADGPYLLLEDLGWKGERAQPSYSSRNNNTVEFHRSLLAKYWETYEYMETGAEGGGEFVWLDQHIYALQDEKRAAGFVRTLMRRATFAKDPSAYLPLAVEGLDAAYRTEKGLEYIAVSGNLVCYLIYGGTGVPESAPGEKDLLNALSERLREWQSAHSGAGAA